MTDRNGKEIVMWTIVYDRHGKAWQCTTSSYVAGSIHCESYDKNRLCRYFTPDQLSTVRGQ